MYQNLGQHDKAVRDRSKAIELKPDDAEPWHNRGAAYAHSRQYDKAIAQYSKAIELKPDYRNAWYHRGVVYEHLRQYDKAIVDYSKVIELKPDVAERTATWGMSCGSRASSPRPWRSLRRGHELGSKNPRWRYPSAQWVHYCERLLELDVRLPDFLTGKAKPANPRERIELARICAGQAVEPGRPAPEEAFAAQPTLVAAHRYNAARVALAGCGNGKDAASSTTRSASACAAERAGLAVRRTGGAGPPARQGVERCPLRGRCRQGLAALVRGPRFCGRAQAEGAGQAAARGTGRVGVLVDRGRRVLRAGRGRRARRRPAELPGRGQVAR